MDTEKFTAVPATRAGDPFLQAACERPCVCLFGVVYVGHIITDENGDELELFEGVTCRRCQEGKV